MARDLIRLSVEHFVSFEVYQDLPGISLHRPEENVSLCWLQSAAVAFGPSVLTCFSSFPYLHCFGQLIKLVRLM